MHIQVLLGLFFKKTEKCNANICTASQKKKKPIYFNSNYRTEMTLVPNIMDYCLIQFDALNFTLGVRLHGGS